MGKDASLSSTFHYKMNNEKKTFQEKNLLHEKRDENSTELKNNKTMRHFHLTSNQIKEHADNQYQNNYKRNLNSPVRKNAKTRKEPKKQVSSTNKTFTPLASTPLILPPPKVVGSQIKFIKKQEEGKSNTQVNKSTEPGTSTEMKNIGENLFNSVAPEKDSTNALKKPLNSQQTEHLFQNENFAAKETNFFVDPKNVNKSFLGTDYQSEKVNDYLNKLHLQNAPLTNNEEEISNDFVNEFIQSGTLTEMKHTSPNQSNFVIPQTNSKDSLEEQLNSQSLEYQVENDAFAAKKIELLEEDNFSHDLKSINESFSGNKTPKENLDQSLEGSIQKDTSSILEKISSMSEEDSSRHEKFSSIQDNDSSSLTEEEFSLYDDDSSSEEDSSIHEEFSSIQDDDSSSLTEEEFSLYDDDSSSEEDSSIHVEFFSIQDDNSSLSDEEFSLYDDDSSSEEDSSIHEEFFLIQDDDSSSLPDGEVSLYDEDSSFEDISSIYEEFFLIQDDDSSSLPDEEASLYDNDSSSEDISSIYEEFSSIQDDDSSSLPDEEASLYDDDSSILEGISSTLEEHFSLHDYLEEETFKGKDKEDKKEKCRHKFLKSVLPHSYLQNEPLPIVKLPVLLAMVNIDIDIFDSFDLLLPISNITKIDWSIHSLESRVLLPSTTIFLRGVLMADIEYVSDIHSLHTVNIQVPWEKTTNTSWLSLPVMSGKTQREFIFQSHDDKEIIYHREFHEHFADQVQHDLRRINFVWHEQLGSQAGASKLCIHGTANLSIDLLQPQYINLNSI
ncbi:MAG TPA: hypothetical protein VEY68_04710 [Anoxybacillus sp.]|nr:hypothetical protein [Anoxybacillus sp.]